jgi:hypothetical protein
VERKNGSSEERRTQKEWRAKELEQKFWQQTLQSQQNQPRQE